MAKKVDDNLRKYDIERVRTSMSRDKLNKLYKEFESDDDYLNYHIEVIEDTHYKYKTTIVNDENTPPIKKSNAEDQGFCYADKDEALQFIEDCIESNRVSSKPKAVMQNGVGKKAVDRYNELIQKEEDEYEAIGQFTKPTFDEIMDNIYVNTYNGSTYNMKEQDIPDDLRENVGVIIPGLIESKEEYFEFVKRLKDRGKNGLGRTIYEKYEDYEEAKDLIETYKQALFDKYGGKEEYFYAKDMGGILGAYEYYPTVKPRFKKTVRNIKLDRGMNINELANIEDMGRRIREEYEEELEYIDVDPLDYKFYEETPPKFRDLPEDLQLFYKTDKYNENGFTCINRFKSAYDYAKELQRSDDPDKQLEGYLITESLDSEESLYEDIYESEFTTIVDPYDLSLESIASQFEYDKKMYEHKDSTIVDDMVSSEEVRNGYRKFLEYHIIDEFGIDINEGTNRTMINTITDEAVKYAFDSDVRYNINERSGMNSVAENIYINKENAASFGKNIKEERGKYRKGENKITQYVRQLANTAHTSLQNMQKDADNVNLRQSIISRESATGTTGSSVDINIDGFALSPTPEELLNYMKNNEKLAKKIYELSSDGEANNAFSERTNIDDFIEFAIDDSKPMFTKNIINNKIKNNNRKGE
jgi:hypothetical protein